MSNKIDKVKRNVNNKYHKYIPNNKTVHAGIKQYAKGQYILNKLKFNVSNQMKIIILILLTILLVVLFYFLIYKTTSVDSHITFLNTTTDNLLVPFDFSNRFTIKHATKRYSYIPNQLLKLTTSTISYTLSFWLQINNISEINWIHLLSLTNKQSCSNVSKFDNSCKQFPGFWLSPNSNRLNITLDTQGNTRELVTVENVKLKKWINVTCSINNYSVDIYINGKLYTNYVLEYRPLLLGETGNIYINENEKLLNKNNVKMAYLRVYSIPLDPAKVNSLYEEFLPKIINYNTTRLSNLNLTEVQPFIDESDTVSNDMVYTEEETYIDHYNYIGELDN